MKNLHLTLFVECVYMSVMNRVTHYKKYKLDHRWRIPIPRHFLPIIDINKPLYLIDKSNFNNIQQWLSLILCSTDDIQQEVLSLFPQIQDNQNFLDVIAWKSKEVSLDATKRLLLWSHIVQQGITEVFVFPSLHSKYLHIADDTRIQQLEQELYNEFNSKK